MRSCLSVVAFLLCSTAVNAALAQCRADNECKGARICVAGDCVDPPAASQPAAIQPAPYAPPPYGQPYAPPRRTNAGLPLIVTGAVFVGVGALIAFGSIWPWIDGLDLDEASSGGVSSNDRWQLMTAGILTGVGGLVSVVGWILLPIGLGQRAAARSGIMSSWVPQVTITPGGGSLGVVGSF